MNRNLLLSMMASSLLLATTTLHAQSLLAGQTTSVNYASFTPAISLVANSSYNNGAGGGEIKTQSVDLDGDGRFDVEFRAYGNMQVPTLYQSFSNTASALHTDVQFYGSVSLSTTNVIQQSMSYANSTGSVGSWGTSAVFTNYYFNPTTPNSYTGDWVDKQDHYIGIRLRSSASAAWRYGWIRVQVTSYNGPASLLVKDYALTNTALAVQSAQAAGWQVYPTYVTGQLTIVPPAAAVAQLTLRDLCGRVQLQAVLPATSSQLDLSALAAGVYVLELEAKAGRFSQRISKY